MSDSIKWELDPALGLNVPVIDMKDADEARRAMTHAAVLESYALLKMLRREQQHDDDMFDYVFVTSIQRLIELNTAMCEGLSTGPGADEPNTVADMIFGANGWRDSRDPGDRSPTETFVEPSPANAAALQKEPWRHAVVVKLAFDLFDSIFTMNDQIMAAGVTASAIQRMWHASFSDLGSRLGLLLSVAQDEVESEARINDELAVLKPVEPYEDWKARQPDQPEPIPAKRRKAPARAAADTKVPA